MRFDRICKELNVRYALEGSVRKVANRIRVTAQLIDGSLLQTNQANIHIV